MAFSLTNLGEQYALLGNGSNNGSIARLASAIRLFTSASVPSKSGVEGVAFVQVANGNGYTTGGNAISAANWSGAVVGGNYTITLVDQTWTATGGSIANVAGAYIVDASNNVLGWWDRTPVTAIAGDNIVLDDLGIRLAL